MEYIDMMSKSYFSNNTSTFAICFCSIYKFSDYYDLTGLEEVMEFLEKSFPTVEIAIAHGKVVTFL